MATSIGKNLGNYTIEAEIGSGGMGEVLLARQNSLDRPAVLKKIRRDLCEVPDLAERLRREARTAAAIHHPNVVAVYDCFSYRGNEYIAQEFVDGVDLETALDRCGALPWRIAALIALEVARGLEEIHTLGTVHRDLKPQNILIGRRGEVKIADFGLALEATGSSLTKPGVMIGSPAYMPPEQMMGERVDARGDLFSLGVLFYEALTNQLPYPDPTGSEGESLLARMQRGRYTKIRKLRKGVPSSVVRIVQGCLRPKAKQRLASAALIRRKLEKRIGTLSPVDLRSELSSWLWERQVFDTRENETVVLVRRSDEATPRTHLRRVWLTAAATVAIATAAFFSYPLFAHQIDGWKGSGMLSFASPGVADEVTSEPAAAAGEEASKAVASEPGPIARAFSLARARITEAVFESPARVDGGPGP
jgi:serine/threonine-protein kinase